VREPEDENRTSEILEPRPAGRERIADEVRSELAGGDEAESRPRADDRPDGTGFGCGLGYARPALCRAA
jgi:hypothetical protein